MPRRIGLLLPRSTDYPAMAFDLLDGMRIYLRNNGHPDAQFFSENIGFGDDLPNVYARAEKLFMQDEADVLVAYANPQNAETLYTLAESTGKPVIFLDAGMQFVNATVPANCTHISLQGLEGCRQMGIAAAEHGRKVLMAISFFDAGFRCSMASIQGIEESHGSVAGNYVSGHKISEFTIDRYLELLGSAQPDATIANFSIYLTELFTAALKKAGGTALEKPFYASPFMFEEQIASKCDFPGGEWHTAQPWFFSLENEANKLFTGNIKTEKNKTANIFHLLGWEAGIVANLALEDSTTLRGKVYESPRGTVTIHPETATTYAPLYKGKIEGGTDGKCSFVFEKAVSITAETHAGTYRHALEMVSGWRNNYFCT